MRKLLVILLTGFFASTAFASAKSDCEAKAAEQKLEGVANMKFVAKCVKDAKKASAKAVTSDAEKKCEEKAVEKNLKAQKRWFTSRSA